MRSSRFTTEQIVQILKEADTETAVRELCRRHGVSEQTYYRWRAKYGAWGSAKRAGSNNWRTRIDASGTPSPS